MALQGPIPVEFGRVFPYGAYIKGEVERVRDFDKSSGDNFVQAKDKDTGERVWQVEVIDADPKAPKGSMKVKLFGEVQPVPPAAPAGYPFAAVEFDGADRHPLRGQPLQPAGLLVPGQGDAGAQGRGSGQVRRHGG